MSLGQRQEGAAAIAIVTPAPRGNRSGNRDSNAGNRSDVQQTWKDLMKKDELIFVKQREDVADIISDKVVELNPNEGSLIEYQGGYTDYFAARMNDKR